MQGIDYGMGTTNVDHETGIRYGVISQHSVGQAWYEQAEADYGKPTCPKCGNELVDEYDGDFEQYGRGCADYACEDCKITIDSQDTFGEEPIGWNYEGEGYLLTDCLDSDIFVLKSPFYTFAPFCSPCVPGAGNLDDAECDPIGYIDPDGKEHFGQWDERLRAANCAPIYADRGAKTYCLGHDWFEDGKAPYLVYSVETGKEV